MTRRRVVIAGGGVGGLEAALALRASAGDRVDVELIAPERRFAYRALSVGEPVGLTATPRFDLQALALAGGFRFRLGEVERVDPHAGRLLTRAHEVVPYDDLVIAVGARAVSAVPGALTFTGPDAVAGLAAELGRLKRRGGGRVAFVAPALVGWTLPLYELALLTEEWARREFVDLELTVLTREGHPLGVFGGPASEEVAWLLDDRGISVRTATFVEEVEDGQVALELESPLEADLVVSLPRLLGPRLAGVPHDEDGFIPVDDLGRVTGASGVYAVGDATTRPLKQGGLAAQQADVAASHIAARAGAEVTVEPYRPRLRGLLLTGESPRYLRRSSREAPSPPSPEALWWPPHKVAGRYLAPFLAANAHLALRDEASPARS